MAELEGRRGQVILVSGFLLAILLVVLAVVANTAVFTQNLASRSATSSGSDALELRHEVDQSVGTMVERINAESYGSYADREAALEDGIATYNDDVGNLSASNGESVRVSQKSETRGIRVAQDTTGTFDSPDDGGSDWKAAGGVDDARNFVVSVDRGTLDQDVTDGTLDEFRIALVDPNSVRWNVLVGDDSDGDPLVRVVREEYDSENGFEPPADGGNHGTCEMSSKNSLSRIDVTAGTVDGNPCEPLDDIWFSSNKLDTQFDVWFNNSGSESGRYQMVLDDSANVPEATPTDAIYETTVRYRYHSKSLSYETDVRVAPGEPDD